MNNDIPVWLLEHYGEMSNFEVAQLQAIQIDNINSIITIFMSALFAYFMLGQFFAKKLPMSQVMVITVVYSLFMFYEAGLLASFLVNTHALQFYVSTISEGGLEEPSLLYFMILPAIALIAWLISVVYMWTSSRQK